MGRWAVGHAILSRTFLAVALAIAAAGSAAGQQLGSETRLPLPRFVSLSDGQVNVRVGAGSSFPIAWTFVRRGWPVEVIQEFDNWRRIRDIDGTDGWVFYNLLSGERTAVVSPQQTTAAVTLHAEPRADSAVTAYLEPGVLAKVDRCRSGWCRLTDARFSGWIDQTLLWGVYPTEEF